MILKGRSDIWRAQTRIPKVIADWVQDEAQKNFRSMNAEIVELLRQAKDRATKNVSH